MNARLVFACAATGIALTAFAAAPASAAPIEGGIAVVAPEGQPTPPTDSPTQPPAEPPTSSPTEPTTPPADPPGEQPAPPRQQVPVTPNGGADTGSLDPAPQQGSDAGVVALGGMVLLAAGGLGVAAHRRRQRV